MGTEIKLSAPIIDNKLPAFTNNKIIIPFQLPKTVSLNDFSKMKVIIKNVQTNKEKVGKIIEVANLDTTMKDGNYIVSFVFYEKPKRDETFNEKETYYAYNSKTDEYVPTIATADNYTNYYVDRAKFMVGQYYKVQIAFVTEDSGSENNIGYYSNSATIKYTSTPKMVIQELEDVNGNNNISNVNNIFTGIYKSEDMTEKVYSYCFDLYYQNILIKTSDIQLHNNLKNTINSNASQYLWNLDEILENGNYRIDFKVITINNLEKTITYNFTISQTNSDNNGIELILENNFDNGYIEISLSGGIFTHTGDFNYILTRVDEQEKEYKIIPITLTVQNKNQKLKPTLVYKDFAIRQGATYTYKLREIDSNNYICDSDTRATIISDFEDAFLSDGDRQLRIRFNPKIASFKNTLLESKMDTIGGKYPFIFRNGNVGYKEFSISGLLSLLSDENHLFIKDNNEEPLRTHTPAAAREKTIDSIQINDFKHNLSTNNIKNERDFKMEVLAWLTNGKPKLFRSPTEGNFIIRLINTSLSPNDTLGRMLHTFSSTAYEIDDYNYQNLQDYNFIHNEKVNIDNNYESIKYKYIFKEDCYKTDILTNSPTEKLNVLSNITSKKNESTGIFYYIKLCPRNRIILYKNSTYL